jgi:DNA polymerase III subunit alpha
MNWVPLHVHSQYSILDSTASIQECAETAAKMQMPALALTDQGNMYGAVEFFKACTAAKIKPIIGCELFVAPHSRLEKKRLPGLPHGYPLVLLAKDKKGYQNLCKLASLAHLEGFYYTPRIDKEILSQYSEGLICLSGGLSSKISALILQEDEAALKEEINWFRQVFHDDYYFELQRHEMSEEQQRLDGMERESWILQHYQNSLVNQKRVGAQLLTLSQEMSVPCVATNDSHYIARDDWKAHEILMNIQSGEPCEIWEKDSFGNLKTRVPNPKRQVNFSHEFYFKSPQEMAVLFADCPDALSQSLAIVDKCQFQLDFKSKYYPVFVPPSLEGKSFTKEERLKEAEQFLRQLCNEGLKKRYGPEQLAKVKEKIPGRDPFEVVSERLAYELEIITSKGMSDYLLIVYDFITWAKRQGIPMGPGRGSGVGSIILYLIEVTDIEPLRFNLFFERFINPERISYPDIDVDICMDRRSEVIDYTVQKYGKERVAQIITFGTMKAKMAIKDVGRVLSIPLPKVNSIAKLIPEELNITLEKALEVEPLLREMCESDEEVRELFDIAKKLEGSVRNTGIHAAGLIICEDPIIDHIPVCVSKDAEMMVTQYSMKPVESVGMLKIDFLGLKTLTSIQKAVASVEQRTGIRLDWINLPLEDQATFDLLTQGKTMGIFQLESAGMQDLARQLHIDKFEEIIAVGSLYRPGPMEMIPSFINRKHGKEALEIDHPLMHDVLAETYGIMVYQEQVMQIASKLASYSLGEGDVLRRAMGKKDREEMSKQREKFRQGALKNGIDERAAVTIFDKVEKFASYGFNKSHAAAYAYLSYVTAYLKANYPKEWMAALLTSDRDDVSKVAKMIRECQSMEIAILPPDINESDSAFAATSLGIRFALTGIKGMGEGVALAIIEERKANGPFKSLAHFMQRIDTRKIGKRAIELLVEAGCFDFTSWSRGQLFESVEPLFSKAVREQKERAQGVIDLFSLLGVEEEFPPPPSAAVIPKQLLLKKEKELLGFYLTGHPLDDFDDLMDKCDATALSEMGEEVGALRTFCVIDSVQVRVASKSQRKFAILTISDKELTEGLELVVWPDLYSEKNHLLVENQLIYAVIQVERAEGELKLQCRWLEQLSKVDDAVIEEASQIYSRIKRQGKMQKPIKESDPRSEREALAKLKLNVDIEHLRLSHILELKALFRSYSGKTAVHLEFVSNGAKVGTLVVESQWGVRFDAMLEERLRQFSAIKNVTLISG